VDQRFLRLCSAAGVGAQQGLGRSGGLGRSCLALRCEHASSTCIACSRSSCVGISRIRVPSVQEGNHVVRVS
jgi:hypothetical protein